VNPFLDSLDCLVGREVPTAGLFPQWPRDRFSYIFGIPDITKYKLRFHVADKTPAGLSSVELQLTVRLSKHDAPAIIDYFTDNLVAEIGHLECEGRCRR
jgi:hypothetical protein